MSDAPERLEMDDTDVLREVLWWGRGVMGIAEATYPHPDSWTFRGVPDARPLSKLTTRALTETSSYALQQLTADSRWRRSPPLLPTPPTAWWDTRELRLTATSWRRTGAIRAGMGSYRDLQRDLSAGR